MDKTMYEIDTYGTAIRQLVVTRSTKDSVWVVRDQREVRRGRNNIYDSWEDARTAIIKRCQDRVNYFEANMLRADVELDDAKEIPVTPPLDPNKSSL